MDRPFEVEHEPLFRSEHKGGNVLIENVPLTVKVHTKKGGDGIPRVERIEEEEE